MVTRFKFSRRGKVVGMNPCSWKYSCYPLGIYGRKGIGFILKKLSQLWLHGKKD
jgi:hypothetical protein